MESSPGVREPQDKVAQIHDRNKRIEKFKFSGQAGEFFGIQFVNNILVMLTLGIYSPWAKVRTLQYFYGNTELANSNFQFTANPVKMLKSRIIAILLFIAYVLAENIGTTTGNILLGCFVVGYFLVAPILTIFVMSFRLRHSAWRGINFNFRKNYREAYRVYLAPLLLLFLVAGSVYAPMKYSVEIEHATGLEPYEWPSDLAEEEAADIEYSDAVEAPESINAEFPPDDIEAPLPEADAALADETVEEWYFHPYLLIPAAVFLALFLLLIPYFDFINMRFLARNTRFGSAQVVYHAIARQYYAIYGKWLVATFLLATCWMLPAAIDPLGYEAVLAPLFIVSLLYFPLSRAYLSSQRYNLLFGETVIGEGHRVRAHLATLQLFWIFFTNSLAIMLSLGLMSAWAKVRVARYILANTELEVNGSLDAFINGEKEKVSALAEELGDAFDLEVSF